MPLFVHYVGMFCAFLVNSNYTNINVQANKMEIYDDFVDTFMSENVFKMQLFNFFPVCVSSKVQKNICLSKTLN